MKRILKQTALVTGATSGIGRAFAECFARKGYNLILTGRRMDMLTALARDLESNHRISVKVIMAEFSEDADMIDLINQVKKYSNINILVNNAGYGCGIEFIKNGIEENLRMLKVHVISSLRLIHAILPQMIERNSGIIINVSSLGAFMPAPRSSMYAATKLFLKSFSESLHMEVRQYGIKVQSLCPGFTITDFHSRRSSEHPLQVNKLMWMDPSELVQKSLNSLEKNCVVCLPGCINKILAGIASSLPRKLYYHLMERSANIKVGPGFLDRVQQLVKKAVSFFLPAHADQIGLLH